jgi:tripartite-type tricarboxylate transporter receptor subunit TctC
MEPHLGVKLVVVNKPGSHGGHAMRDVWSRRHDGYRWGGFSVTTLVAPVMNAHDTTAEDWTYFLIAGSPGVLSVAYDSPWETFDDLLAAVRANPGRVNAAASTTGGIWHTKLLTLERAAGITFNYIPYNGSNPSQLALLSAEVAVVLTSVSEQAELIKARKLRPLAVLEPEPYAFPELGTIPSIGAWYSDAAALPISQWLGFALPADTPADALHRITTAFEQAMASEDVQALLKQRLLTPLALQGETADRQVRQMQRAWCWLLDDLGITERSPAAFGIARP